MPELIESHVDLASLPKEERLARMRADQPRKPYVERVRVGIVDPRSGKLYQARGAVAISPDRAARLVLLGPGGTTALDVWVTKEHFRIAIPAACGATGMCAHDQYIFAFCNRDAECAATSGGFLRYALLQPS